MSAITLTRSLQSPNLTQIYTDLPKVADASGFAKRRRSLRRVGPAVLKELKGS